MPKALMHLRALIFDIDGTLVDSNDAHARCWQEAFAKFGKDIAFDVVRHQIGKGGDLLVPDLLDAKEMRRFGENLKKHRGELWKSDYMPHVKPFPGVVELFTMLRERGAKIALASSANPDEVDYYSHLLGVEDLIVGSTSKEDAKWSKPNPEIFEAALEQTGSSVERTLAVGDTPYDILAAHRMALPVAAVLSGGFERELLAKAEFLFADIRELGREIERVDAYFSD